jgi:hypothetical protein
MNNNGHTNVIGYSDSDWAGNALDCRSTTGYCMFVSGNLVSWKSKKQRVVAHSSVEAKYRAMASAACELVWLKCLLTDLGCPCSIPRLFVVIIKQPCTLCLILFFINARSILKLIVTTLSTSPVKAYYYSICAYKWSIKKHNKIVHRSSAVNPISPTIE